VGAAAGVETGETANGGAGGSGGGAALVSTETSALRQASPGVKRANRRWSEVCRTSTTPSLTSTPTARPSTATPNLVPTTTTL